MGKSFHRSKIKKYTVFQEFLLDYYNGQPTTTVKDLRDIVVTNSELQARHYTSSMKGRMKEINTILLCHIKSIKNPLT